METEDVCLFLWKPFQKNLPFHIHQYTKSLSYRVTRVKRNSVIELQSYKYKELQSYNVIE